LSLPNFVTPGPKVLGIVYQLATVPSSPYSSVPILVSTDAGYQTSISLFAFSGYQPYTAGADILKSSGSIATSPGLSKALDTSPHAILFEYDGGTNIGAASYAWWVDSIAQTQTASGSFFGFASGVPSVGSLVTTSNAISQNVNGSVAEYHIFQGTLSAAGVATMNGYYSRHYGL
jgi:hypothetical protein